MKTVKIITGIILAIVFVAIYIFFNVRKQENLNETNFETIAPLYRKLKSGQPLTSEDVLPYAKGLLTREVTFEMLNEYGKIDLFPKEFYTIERAAESRLANWLVFPTELDACPDEIEHIKRVTFDEQNNHVHYEVFKYRVNEPHWAAKDGWMLGVVGPYYDESRPYDFPQATFSRVSSTIDKVSPEEEARWVHENILTMQ